MTQGTSSRDAPSPRSTSQRRADVQAALDEEHRLWLATGNALGPHMIPLSYVWNGEHITMATFEGSPTTANIEANGTARAAVGHYDDVTMIDGTARLVPVDEIEPDIADAYAQVSFDPRVMSGLVYLRFHPLRIQAWNGFHEFGNRFVMRGGTWLSDQEPAPDAPRDQPRDQRGTP